MPVDRSTIPPLPKPGHGWPVAASSAKSWALMVEEMIRRRQSGAAAAVATWAAGAAAFGADLAGVTAGAAVELTDRTGFASAASQ